MHEIMTAKNDSDTTLRILDMAGIELGTLNSNNFDQNSDMRRRFDLAEIVLRHGCQAINTQEMCSPCHDLAQTPTMCQRRNGTINT